MAGTPGAGISNVSATVSGPLGDDPATPNKGCAVSTLKMLQDTLRGELSRERAELRKEVSEALGGFTERITSPGVGLEKHSATTLQAVDTITTVQAAHGLRIQKIQEDTSSLGTRLPPPWRLGLQRWRPNSIQPNPRAAYRSRWKGGVPLTSLWAGGRPKP